MSSAVESRGKMSSILKKGNEGSVDNHNSFDDTTGNASPAADMELLAAAQETNELMHLFIANKHDETVRRIQPVADKSIYHSLARCAVGIIKAFVTFEKEEIAKGLEEVKKSLEVCNRHRRRLSIINNMVTKMMKRPNYNSYTEVECHAELCYAECLLARALLSFIYDDTLVNFVKGGLRIRLCYQAYKECQDILEHREWPNATLKAHFESGVKMGLGAFNLLISGLPSRILRLLEFVGFSGDRDLGLKLLEEARMMHLYIRGPLASLSLFGYYAIIRFALGNGDDGHCLIYAEEILKKMELYHPESIIIHFCAGRLQSAKGNIREAIRLLELSQETEVDWQKTKHVAVWELAWCHLILGEWRKAAEWMNVLCRDSMWSRSIYHYVRGACLEMSEDCTEEETREGIRCMRETPVHLQRFCGKSIPAEKFFVKKALRYVNQGNWLMLPIYEMMYIWNYFAILKGKNDLLAAIVRIIERELKNLEENYRSLHLYMDNYCLGTLLKGVCLRLMGSPLSAEELFIEVYNNAKDIKEDKYLISFTLMELGYICEESENYEQAVEYLNAAKENKLFSSEFRIHEALLEIRRKGYDNGTNSLPMIINEQNGNEQLGTYTFLSDDSLDEPAIFGQLENTHI